MMGSFPFGTGAGDWSVTCAAAATRGVDGGGVRDRLRRSAGGLMGRCKLVAVCSPSIASDDVDGGGVSDSVVASESSLRRLVGGNSSSSSELMVAEWVI